MASLAGQLSGAERLPFHLHRAQRAALDRRHPVLASFSIDLDAAVWPSALNAGPYFLWEQPERGLALHAAGEATRIVMAGPSRFADAREAFRRLLDAAIGDGMAAVGAGPLGLGAFAFDPSRHDDEAWRDFPDGVLIVPRLLFRRDGESASLTFNALVDAASNTEAVGASLIDDAMAVLSHAPAEAGTESITPVLADDGRDAWRLSVRALTEQIAAERVDKVVLARRVAVQALQPFDLDAALGRLRERYRNCTIFAVHNGDACFLGATPELLVRREGDQVRADCLAGSAARGQTPADDERLGASLLADDKERREHTLVTQGIRAALDGLCDEVRIPATPSLRKMANVQHLYTPIEATTAGDRHVLEFVERLHPTAAVAGLPRDRSLCLIREQEDFSRGWYAGPIGWLDARGDGEFAVALRSAVVRGNEALLYAGCGIVRGSDPDREYEESAIKLEAMRWALTGKS